VVWAGVDVGTYPSEQRLWGEPVIQYRILPEDELIVVCAWGTITEEEIIRMSGELRSDPDFSPGYDTLVDDTHLEHTATGDELRRLAEPRVQPSRPDVKIAVVAPTDLAYGTSRMHQLLAEYRSPQHIEVFRVRSKALDWLGVESAHLDGLFEERAGQTWRRTDRP
jgi:hypothetical protein